MKKILPLLLLLTAGTALKAQTWECGYVDLGQGIIEQTVILTETGSGFIFNCKDTVNQEFVSQLNKAIPGYDEILDIDFGPTTFIYTIDGGAIVFRKCKASEGNRPMAENSEGNTAQ